MSSATLQIGIKADYDFLDDGTPDELGQRVLERVRTAIASTGALDDPLAPCDEHEIGVTVNANQYIDKITEFVHQSLLSNDMRPERIAGLIAAYGLMSPEEFIEAIEDNIGPIRENPGY
jgi:hypothetical protein